MRYIIQNRDTGRVFQPMRVSGDMWVNRDQVNPADTFPTEADARARLDEWSPVAEKVFEVVPL